MVNWNLNLQFLFYIKWKWLDKLIAFYYICKQKQNVTRSCVQVHVIVNANCRNGMRPTTTLINKLPQKPPKVVSDLNRAQLCQYGRPCPQMMMTQTQHLIEEQQKWLDTRMDSRDDDVRRTGCTRSHGRSPSPILPANRTNSSFFLFWNVLELVFFRYLE